MAQPGILIWTSYGLRTWNSTSQRTIQLPCCRLKLLAEHTGGSGGSIVNALKLSLKVVRVLYRIWQALSSPLRWKKLAFLCYRRTRGILIYSHDTLSSAQRTYNPPFDAISYHIDLVYIRFASNAYQNMSNPPFVVSGSTGGAPNRLEIYDFVKNDKFFSLYIQALRAYLWRNFSSSRSYWTIPVVPEAMQKENQSGTPSFFQVGGIHGLPYVPWNGVRGQRPWNPNTTWGGYCTHGSVLFPTWHRPYMMLFEVGSPLICMVFWALTMESASKLSSSMPWKSPQLTLLINQLGIQLPPNFANRSGIGLRMLSLLTKSLRWNKLLSLHLMARKLESTIPCIIIPSTR